MIEDTGYQPARRADPWLLWLIPALMVSCTSTGPGAADLSTGMVSVQSPDGTIQMTLRGNGPLTYSVSLDGKVLLADSKLGLKFRDGMILGANARLTKVERSSSDTTGENRLGKRRTMHDHHNEVRVSLVEASGQPFQVVVRAFDDGIGFRYVMPAVTSAPTQEFVLEEERTQFSFPGNYLCYAGINENTGTPGKSCGLRRLTGIRIQAGGPGGFADGPGPDVAASGQESRRLGGDYRK
jgi:alpha-glucosidase